MWRIIEKEIDLNGKSIKTYGIGAETIEINDISTHKSEVEKFVNLLNRLGASEMHAYDLADDFMER